jgi:hypothetical protein
MKEDIFKYFKTYLMKFSKRSLIPPIVRRRKPQLTNPVKLSNPDDHENRESRGVWHLQYIVVTVNIYKTSYTNKTKHFMTNDITFYYVMKTTATTIILSL